MSKPKHRFRAQVSTVHAGMTITRSVNRRKEAKWIHHGEIAPVGTMGYVVYPHDWDNELPEFHPDK